MKKRIEEVRQFLQVATSPAITEWPAIVAVTFLSILIHLLASFDIGYEQLLPRLFLAGISVLPTFILIVICRRLHFQNENVSLGVVILAITVGGLARGAIIDTGLHFLEIASNAITDFRIFAGVIISLTTNLIIGYAWATIQKTRTILTRLREENQQLAFALHIMEEESYRVESQRELDLLESVKNRVRHISSQPLSQHIEQLEKLITGFIRPISKDWAKDLKEYELRYSESPEVTLRGVWGSLDPVKHLPSPVLSIFIIILSALAASVGTFGSEIALQLAFAIGITLLITLPIGFSVVRKFLGGPRNLLKDFLLTLSLVVMTVPTLLVAFLVLRNTSNPTAFVLPGLVTVPLMGWILMVGNAALYQSQVIIEQLNTIKHQLRWSIARINLLSWYQQGLISRLLHGPIQNSIQVGLIKIQSANSDSEQVLILEQVLHRIDEAIHEISSDTKFTSSETEALAKIESTWAGVAQVKVMVPDDCKDRLKEDPAALSIAVDLIHELCSNAIRHGGATSVSLTLETSPDSLMISGQDNGSTFRGLGNTPGLGTHFIQSCTIHYRFESNEHKNQYYLEIPISK